jgi:sRNA-binding carbon storage regulator CsrA
MLMLTRGKGQAVDITDTTTGAVIARVLVLEVGPGQCVRLGFDAPRHIKILRDNAVKRDGPRDDRTPPLGYSREDETGPDSV